MKIIFNIARTELRQMFCSPVAWFVLVIFAVQCGFTFTDAFDNVLGRQIMNYMNWDISRGIFAIYQGAMLPAVQKYLFLYIPLITMGMVNRERNNGTISLLYSAPISPVQIILGKYAALMVFGLALMAVLMVPFVFSCFTVQAFNAAAVLTAFLGIYLLICTYAAIGLFMSCVIAYPVAAGICTMALFIVLKQAGGIWQDIEGVREITYWLGIDGHAGNLLSGLVASEDILYYILVSLLFVSWSVLYLYLSCRVVPVWKRAAWYTAVMVAVVGAGVLTAQPKWKFYHDASYENANSLKPEHQEIVKHLTGELTITTYSNLFDRQSLTPQGVLESRKMLESYIRFKPDIRLKYVWYYDDGKNHADEEAFRKEALRTAMVRDVDFDKYLPPKEIRPIIDLYPEDYRYVQVLEYEGKTTRLRHYNDPASIPMEADYVAAFKRLGMKLPMVAFLKGHDERSIQRTLNKDYTHWANGKRNRKSLENQGFDVQAVSLSDDRNVLDSCDLLVIADPRKPFEAWEQQQIETFIEKGGNLIVTAERESREVLEPLLSYLGVTMRPDYLLQQHESELPDLVLATPDSASVQVEESFKWSFDDKLVMKGASALRWNAVKDFVYAPVFVSSADCWLSGSLPGVKADGSYALSGIQGKQVTGLGLSRPIQGKREQRILITGDADWLSDGELNSSRSDIRSANAGLIQPLLGWFSYGELPIDTGRRIPPDEHLYFQSDDTPWMHAFFWGVVPVALAIMGIVVIVKRRRK